jgi:very-short-patch-repair endonuclease
VQGDQRVTPSALVVLRPAASRAKEAFMRARSHVLAQYAHENRCAATPPEEKLWWALRARQLLGVTFRRQVVIQGFIADFVAPAQRLIVEVDGKHHERRRNADARRDEKLRRAGYRVLRLEAELVSRELPVALERIAAALGVEQGR